MKNENGNRKGNGDGNESGMGTGIETEIETEMELYTDVDMWSERGTRMGIEMDMDFFELELIFQDFTSCATGSGKGAVIHPQGKPSTKSFFTISYSSSVKSSAPLLKGFDLSFVP